MGFNYRKSFKIGKNTRINLSRKGGIGISTFIKGLMVSKNAKGTKFTASAGGLKYQKKYLF